MPTRCFLLDPVDLYEQSLRRYASGANDKCAVQGWHRARTSLGHVRLEEITWKHEDGAPLGGHASHMLADPRWPTHCACGYAFADDDSRIFDQDQLWKRSDTGEIIHLRDAPAGAMWLQNWLTDEGGEYKGRDGRSIVVRLPGGHDWIIDSRARNCDSPCKTCRVPYHAHSGQKDGCGRYEDSNPHKCWNRVGEPPNLTVGKGPGPSCGAGGGSIAAPGYHGFLRNGELTDDVDGRPRPAASSPAPGAPSPYVRLSELLTRLDIPTANLADTYARETGQSISQAELDRALKKGADKGTFIEKDGVLRHVTRQ